MLLLNSGWFDILQGLSKFHKVRRLPSVGLGKPGSRDFDRGEGR